jgi:hypothetical protein
MYLEREGCHLEATTGRGPKHVKVDFHADS